MKFMDDIEEETTSQQQLSSQRGVKQVKKASPPGKQRSPLGKVVEILNVETGEDKLGLRQKVMELEIEKEEQNKALQLLQEVR